MLEKETTQNKIVYTNNILVFPSRFTSSLLYVNLKGSCRLHKHVKSGGKKIPPPPYNRDEDSLFQKLNGDAYLIRNIFHPALCKSPLT